jgi:TatD DNase family protein
VAQYSTCVRVCLRKVGVIDAHIHLSFIPLEKRVDFFTQSQAAGTTEFILGGYNPTDWDEQLAILRDRRQNNGQRVYTCFGLHPWHIRNSPASQLAADFLELVRTMSKADFVGETGIDRFADMPANKDKLQVEYFEKHLVLAEKHKKPVVLHIVKAHAEALEILQKHSRLKGIVHGFAGAPELAKRYYDLGFKISIGPGVLNENGYRKLKDTVSDLPLEHLVLESDSPESPEDLTPNPRLLFEVATAVAKLKRISREKVLQASNENLRSILPVR